MGNVNSDHLAPSVGDPQPPSIPRPQSYRNKISQIPVIDTPKIIEKLETLRNKLQEPEKISQLSALEASRGHEEVEALHDGLHDLEATCQVSALETSQRHQELEALRSKLHDPEKEIPEEKYNRLYSEKSAKIESLKTHVEEIVKEDDELKMKIVE